MMLSVTPFAGVWIEMYFLLSSGVYVMSLPSRECGLKCWISVSEPGINSHSLRGSVDWNCEMQCFRMVCLGHSLRGSVDWNFLFISYTVNTGHVTPFAGVWIEIKAWRSKARLLASLPSRECGLKFHIHHSKLLLLRHSLRGSVDWNIVLTQSSASAHCHSLRGSVDWNFSATLICRFTEGHSLRGSVDWNLCRIFPFQIC